MTTTAIWTTLLSQNSMVRIPAVKVWEQPDDPIVLRTVADRCIFEWLIEGSIDLTTIEDAQSPGGSISYSPLPMDELRQAAEYAARDEGIDEPEEAISPRHIISGKSRDRHIDGFGDVGI